MGLSKAIKGATKPKEAPPKEKYTDSIHTILQSNHNDLNLKDFFDLLHPRLGHCNNHDDLDIVAIKAHVLFHTHVLSDNFYALPKYYLWGYIADYDNEVEQGLLPTFPPTSANKLANSYNRYLHQRLCDYKQLKIDPLREKRDKTSVVDNSQPVVINLAPSSTNLLDQAQCIIVQVRLILDCNFTPEMLDNELYQYIFGLLATDLATLFQFLTLTLVHALQNFFSLARPDAERTLFIYKEFTQLQIIDEVQNFIALGPCSIDLVELQVPNALQQNEQSIQQLTRALESYLFKRDEQPRHAPPPPPPRRASSIYTTQYQPKSRSSSISSSMETATKGDYTYKTQSSLSSTSSEPTTANSTATSPITPDNNEEKDQVFDIFSSLDSNRVPTLEFDSRLSLTAPSIASSTASSTRMLLNEKPLPNTPSSFSQAQHNLHTKTRNMIKAFKK